MKVIAMLDSPRTGMENHIKSLVAHSVNAEFIGTVSPKECRKWRVVHFLQALAFEEPSTLVIACDVKNTIFNGSTEEMKKTYLTLVGDTRRVVFASHTRQQVDPGFCIGPAHKISAIFEAIHKHYDLLHTSDDRTVLQYLLNNDQTTNNMVHVDNQGVFVKKVQKHVIKKQKQPVVRFADKRAMGLSEIIVYNKTVSPYNGARISTRRYTLSFLLVLLVGVCLLSASRRHRWAH